MILYLLNINLSVPETTEFSLVSFHQIVRNIRRKVMMLCVVDLFKHYLLHNEGRVSGQRENREKRGRNTN